MSIRDLRLYIYPYVSESTLRIFLTKEGIRHYLAATRLYLSKDQAATRFVFA
jgi:hypothetical protein